MTWAASQNKATCWRGFPIKLLRVTLWQAFWKNVEVRYFTADSNLLKPTECVNSTPHTSHFLAPVCTLSCHIDIGSSLEFSAHFTPSHLHPLMMWLFWFSATLLSTSCCPSSLLSSCSSSWSTLLVSMMWVTNTLRTLTDKDLGTLVRVRPSTTVPWNKDSFQTIGQTSSCFSNHRVLNV